MFSVRQKRDIADKVQKLLRETEHPELPDGEIEFVLLIKGRTGLGYLSYANIYNNNSVPDPGVNQHNELRETGSATDA